MKKILALNIEEFKYQENTILKNINLSIHKGECLVLTGLSGCGKTTLLRLINGLIPEIYSGSLKGSIKINGRDIGSFKNGEKAKYVGNVFQNTNDQFFLNSIEDEIALIGENLGMDRKALTIRVRDAMDKLDLVKFKDRPIKNLSGGQKQKVAIGSSLVYDTDLILFDEPSSSLDFSSIEDLRKSIQYLKKIGKTILIAEHRLYYLVDILDRLIILKDGQIENIFKPDDLSLDLQKNEGLRSFYLTGLESEANSYRENTRIEVKDLLIENKHYHLDYTIDFDLKEGECMAVLAANGMGKTTLAKQLVGLLDIKKGWTSYGNNKEERLKNTSISLQNCADMFFFESVERELIPRDLIKDEEYLNKVKQYLLRVDLWDKRTSNPQDLSGGEKQRLSIILAMLKKSDFLILDEPTAGLDYKRMELVSGLIKEKVKETPTLLITHDLELLFKVANTVLILREDGYRKIDIKENEDIIYSFFKENISQEEVKT